MHGVCARSGLRSHEKRFATLPVDCQLMPAALPFSAMSKPSDKPSGASVKSAQTSQIAGFEASLNELEQLVTRMEGGDLSLDESLKSFERGIALFRNCQGSLEQAQLRVRQLLDPENPESAQPFEHDD